MTRISDINRSVGYARTSSKKVSPKDSMKEANALVQSREEKILAFVNSKIRDLASTEVESKTFALKAFLEAALLNEFGSKLLNDSQFSRLVNRVQGAIENDLHLQKAAARLSEKLICKTR
jgi:uncharacterized phage protein gp47/JayE